LLLILRKTTEGVVGSEICGSGEESDGGPGNDGLSLDVPSTGGQAGQLKTPLHRIIRYPYCSA